MWSPPTATVSKNFSNSVVKVLVLDGVCSYPLPIHQIERSFDNHNVPRAADQIETELSLAGSDGQFCQCQVALEALRNLHIRILGHHGVSRPCIVLFTSLNHIIKQSGTIRA